MRQEKPFILLLSFFILLGPAVLHAQQPYHLDTNVITIGEQAVLTIEDPQHFVEMQQLSQNGVIVAGQTIDSLPTDEGYRIVQRNRITSFEAGDRWLKLSEEDSLMLRVLDVEGVDTSSLDIKDIAPIAKEPYTFWEIFRWILLGLIVAGIVVGIVYVIRRRRSHESILPKALKPSIPADAQALQELDALRQQQLWQQGKAKEYHTRLTDIVRGYMEEMFGIRATEMTTDETLDAFMQTTAHSEQTEVMLRQMLTTADMVKFAKSEPMPYEHDRSMTNAVAFVMNTRPRPVEDAEKEKETKEEKQ
ncbi:MAG: hypothetical protein IJ620_06225 [Bacteroidales bacterium]|nr:hypothetical protein [Bacteroidales bacterium]